MRVFVTQLDVPPPVPNAVASGIAAAPGGQVAATPLTGRENIVTTVTAGAGVVLQVIAGQKQGVFAAGGGGVALTVYPAAGTQFKGSALNVPVTLPDGTHATYTFDGTQTWYVAA